MFCYLKLVFDKCLVARNGTANVFLAMVSLAGRRFRTGNGEQDKKDFAVFVEGIARQYPDAEDITFLVLISE